MTDHELIRFMKLVNVSSSGCWEWNGSKVRNYGTFALKIDGKWKSNRAHRVSFSHFVGECSGLVVCHRCDNPSCVNPDHLFSGTQKDNLQDASKKGRIYKGGAKTSHNRKKTHCVRGHELSGDNLSKYSKRRVCKACMRLKNKARKMKEQQDANPDH